MTKREFLETIAQNMKKYREDHGLTQERFAENAGISLAFCAAIETGRKAPSAFTLRSMADKLGVTVDYFLYQVSTQAEVKAISVQLTDKDSEYVAFIGRLISTCNDYYEPDKELDKE